MRCRRRGRVGLLEVVFSMFAIALLTGLLLPAMQSSRSASRRSVCQNNLRQYAMSLAIVEKLQRRFPGYANVVGRKRASWVVMILPQLERNDLYQNWHREDIPPNYPVKSFGDYPVELIAWLEILVCPSAERVDTKRTAPLSYVVNSGSARTANDFLLPTSRQTTWVEDLASGVFFNRARADYSKAIRQPNPFPPAKAFAPRAGPVMTEKYIREHDGTTYTIMLTESLEAGSWALDPLEPERALRSEFQMRQSTSIVWFVTGQKDNQRPVGALVASEKSFDPSLLGINRRRGLAKPLPLEFRYVRSSNYGGLAAARPSSKHSDGANVAYCGGNVSYLGEEIDYRVYTQLMTPNGREVVVDIDSSGEPIRANTPAGTSQRVATPWEYELDENAF